MKQIDTAKKEELLSLLGEAIKLAEYLDLIEIADKLDDIQEDVDNIEYVETDYVYKIYHLKLGVILKTFPTRKEAKEFAETLDIRYCYIAREVIKIK